MKPRTRHGHGKTHVPSLLKRSSLAARHHSYCPCFFHVRNRHHLLPFRSSSKRCQQIVFVVERGTRLAISSRVNEAAGSETSKKPVLLRGAHAVGGAEGSWSLSSAGPLLGLLVPDATTRRGAQTLKYVKASPIWLAGASLQVVLRFAKG